MNKHNLMKKMASIATELDYAGFTKEAKTVDQIFLKLSMEDIPALTAFQSAERDYGYGKNQEHQEKFFNAKDNLRNKLKNMASSMGILSEDGYISPRTFDSRLKKFAQSNPSVPGAVAPVGGVKPEPDGILDQLDSKTQNTGNEEAEASKRVKELTADYNNALRNYEKEEYTFKKTEEALNELKDSPFARVAPFGIKDGCSKLGEMFNNVMEPEEIADIYQQFVTGYEKLLRLKQIIQDESEKASIAVASDPKARLQQSEFEAGVENKINQIVQDNNLLQVKFMKQQRLFTQFNLLYKDMFTYYSVMSQLCQVKTQYEKDVKNFKFGNNEDWQALLGYYEYLISLLQVMASKAVQVVPKNAANIQNVYKNLINEIQGEINELSMAPLKQMYGGGR